MPYRTWQRCHHIQRKLFQLLLLEEVMTCLFSLKKATNSRRIGVRRSFTAEALRTKHSSSEVLKGDYRWHQSCKLQSEQFAECLCRYASFFPLSILPLSKKDQVLNEQLNLQYKMRNVWSVHFYLSIGTQDSLQEWSQCCQPPIVASSRFKGEIHGWQGGHLESAMPLF